MIERVKALWKDEEGASVVEYALLVALIAMIGMVTLGPLGLTVQGFFGDLNTAMP